MFFLKCVKFLHWNGFGVNCKLLPVRSWCEGFCEGGVSQFDSEAGYLEVSLAPVKQVILRFPWLQDVGRRKPCCIHSCCVGPITGKSPHLNVCVVYLSFWPGQHCMFMFISQCLGPLGFESPCSIHSCWVGSGTGMLSSLHFDLHDDHKYVCM